MITNATIEKMIKNMPFYVYPGGLFRKRRTILVALSQCYQSKRRAKRKLKALQSVIPSVRRILNEGNFIADNHLKQLQLGIKSYDKIMDGEAQDEH